MKRTGKKSAMYFRMLRRAAILRKGQAAAALAAIIVATAASTAMLNLYTDVQSKLRKEFRKFGANIVVQTTSSRSGGVQVGAPTTPSSGSFPSPVAGKISAIVSGRGLVAPFAYAVARTEKGQSVVVAATDFNTVRQLNPWWSVSAWPKKNGEAIVGVRAAKALAAQQFRLSYQGRSISLKSAGTVQTGAGEDSRVYLSLSDFNAWTGLQPSIFEIAAYGTPEQVSAMLAQLQHALPEADVGAVRQVTEGEANILGKTRSTLLWSSACIVIIAALCVLATLMGWVFDRRRDFAVMKALGASDWLIAFFVAGEASLLGLAGAVIGFAAGVGIAAIIGRFDFHAPVMPQFGLFPLVVGGALIVTLISTLLPLRLLRGIQPAMILRGE